MPAIIPVLLPPPVSARSLPPADGDGELVSSTAAAGLVAVLVCASDGASVAGEVGVSSEGLVGASPLAAPHLYKPLQALVN